MESLSGESLFCVTSRKIWSDYRKKDGIYKRDKRTVDFIFNKNIYILDRLTKYSWCGRRKRSCCILIIFNDFWEGLKNIGKGFAMVALSPKGPMGLLMGHVAGIQADRGDLLEQGCPWAAVVVCTFQRSTSALSSCCHQATCTLYFVVVVIEFWRQRGCSFKMFVRVVPLLCQWLLSQ